MKKICFAICLHFMGNTLVAQTKSADLLVYNATIYTADSQFSKVQAMAIDQGKIVAVGKSADLQQQFTFSKKLDAKGRYIYPGFNDAHAHFIGYALGLSTINLMGTKSWEDVMALVKQTPIQTGNSWILGRGWDQNDWKNKSFPTNEALNQLYPNQPVLLQRVDGHAAIANNKALELAGINPQTKVEGGLIVLKNGQPTGVLVDNAVDLVTAKIPAASEANFEKAMLQAQQNCLSVGLTSVSDCGISLPDVTRLQLLQQQQKLKIRIAAMLSDAPDNLAYFAAGNAIRTERLRVAALKMYADGALGSRGACLLHDYNDQPGWKGFLLSSYQHFDSVANLMHQMKLQLCTHAIGDSGNRTVLSLYGHYLQGHNNERWRIEHAQVVNPSDFSLFKQYSIVPSVQPTHATSDMYWAEKRLGKARLSGAYAYQTLLQQNGWLPLGTDFPVEDISPMKTFYAAITRMDQHQFPVGGYLPNQKLTRKQALYGITLWAAKANFEDHFKGSLEPGKVADFILMDQDWMHCAPQAILTTQVLATYVNGELLYSRSR